MYVCMYVCMYVMYVCMYVCIYKKEIMAESPCKAESPMNIYIIDIFRQLKMGRSPCYFQLID